MNKNNKAQVNKVFVYLSSMLLIIFVGFLVIKFIYHFEGSVDTKIQSKIYSNIEKDYNVVLKDYGSEKVVKYRLPENVKYICFISDLKCFNHLTKQQLNTTYDGNESLNAIFNAGDNIALFSKDDIINSGNIGEFIIKDFCQCIQPNNNFINLVIENIDNKVHISKLED